MHVSPEQFYSSFLAVAKVYGSQLVQNWEDDREYTRLVRYKFLPTLAQRLGLLCYSTKDYYTLDAVFYVNADTKHFPPGEWIYVEYISIALEHEHNSGGRYGSNVEMNKLQLFNCPLKVLITYPNPSDKKSCNPAPGELRGHR